MGKWKIDEHVVDRENPGEIIGFLLLNIISSKGVLIDLNHMGNSRVFFYGFYMA